MHRTLAFATAAALAAALSSPAAAQTLPPPQGAAPEGFGILPQQPAPQSEPADAEPAQAETPPAPAETPAPAEPPAEPGSDAADPADGDTAEPAAPETADPGAATGPDAAPEEQVLEIVRDTFDDWQVRCLPDGNDCFLYQLALDGDGNPVAEFSIVRLPAGQEAVAGATVVTPLGTLLPAGLYMQIDQSEVRQYPFTFCSQVGCFAQLALAQETVSALQRGRTVQLVVASIAAPDDPVELDLSLLGFTAAYNSIQPGQ